MKLSIRLWIVDYIKSEFCLINIKTISANFWRKHIIILHQYKINKITQTAKFHLWIFTKCGAFNLKNFHSQCLKRLVKGEKCPPMQKDWLWNNLTFFCFDQVFLTLVEKTPQVGSTNFCKRLQKTIWCLSR